MHVLARLCIDRTEDILSDGETTHDGTVRTILAPPSLVRVAACDVAFLRQSRDARQRYSGPILKNPRIQSQ
jgi:hypothetical protein